MGGIMNPYQDTVNQQAQQAGGGMPSVTPETLAPLLMAHAPQELKSDKVKDRRGFWDSIAEKMHSAWENLSGGVAKAADRGFKASDFDNVIPREALDLVDMNAPQVGKEDQGIMGPPSYLASLHRGRSQASGGPGAQSQGQGPLVRSTTGTAGVRPSSPGVTNGRSAPTQQPPSVVPNAGGQGPAQEGASRPSGDPMMAQLKQMFEGMDAKKGKLDLAPLAALTDSWTGSHLAQSYDRPLTDRQIEQMKMQMAEQMAKRQSDIEWHRDRVNAQLAGQQSRLEGVQYQTDGKQDVAEIGAKARTGAAGINAAARAANGKPAPAISPDERSLKSMYAPQIKSYLQTSFDDPTGGKAIPGAVTEAHHQVMAMAQALMQQNPGRYPDIRTAYHQAVQDLPVLGGRFSGLKPRGQGKQGWKSEGEGGDAD